MRIPHGLRAVAGRSVVNPRDFFDVKLYTGNGSTQTISGLGFSPDLVWIKSRSFAESHRILDKIRTATKVLYSDLTNAEGTDSTGLTAFNSDGFTLGSSTAYNQSSSTFVAWAWDAGSSTVTNTQGSITSTVSVRANATAGFSVVTYTGTATNCTVGHGLGVAPDILIAKRRDSSGAWYVYHRTLGDLTRLQLNETSAATVGTSFWNSTNPTSTVFSIGSDSQINANGGTFVVYAFAPVVGYSSFGSYTGNGSATGPVISGLGFEPYFVMIKASSRTGDWFMYDAIRSISNPRTDKLKANSSAAEDTAGEDIDFQSDGFQIKNTDTGLNENAATYIYAAFA
jgi:hypothetical protein